MILLIVIITGSQTTLAVTPNITCDNCTHDEVLSKWIVSLGNKTMAPVVVLFENQLTPDELKNFKDINFTERFNLPSEITLIKSYGGNVTRTFTIVNVIAANVPKDKIFSLQNDPRVKSVDPDFVGNTGGNPYSPNGFDITYLNGTVIHYPYGTIINMSNGAVIHYPNPSSNSISLLSSTINITKNPSPPILLDPEKHAIVNAALSVPGLKAWSDQWQYEYMDFIGSTGSTVSWNYAVVHLKLPTPNNAPFYCQYGWSAAMKVDLQTKQVIEAYYPTIKNHDCNLIVGGGPGLQHYTNNTSFLAPLKQIAMGVTPEKVTCSNGLVLIKRTHTNSVACVKLQTAQRLVERGWGWAMQPIDSIKSLLPNRIIGLENDTGIVTLGNQTYYFETPNYTDDAYIHPVQISFHDVLFTLFPSGFRGGLPLPCSLQGSGGYYWADAKFADGTHQLLHIFGWFTPCTTDTLPTMFSNHTNPQAGLTFYDGKMKLVVSASVTNSTEVYTTSISQPMTVQTNNVRGTIKDVPASTPLTELASSSTGIELNRGGCCNLYDHDGIKLELYHGKTSDSRIISATVENVGKRTAHIYGLLISGFIAITNSTAQYHVVVLQDKQDIIPKEDAILEPGESQTKYIVGNWTITGKPVNGFAASTWYSYDDLQNYNGMTNGYSMSVPEQFIP